MLVARGDLYRAIEALRFCLCTNCGAAPHVAVARMKTGSVFASTLAIFSFSNLSPFAVLQSRVHEVWARFFSSSMKDDLRYTPSDCLETFPFPARLRDRSEPLEAAGQTYNDHRAT